MKNWIALPLLAIVALVAAACDSSGGDDSPESRRYTGDPIAGDWEKPDFTLTGTDGEPYELRDETEGYVTAVYFGYTYCPDICPTHMADLAAALDENPELAEKVKVVFVTVDPARDTGQRLRDWLDLFNEDFIGLTGTEQSIDDASKAVLNNLWRPFATYVTHSGDDHTNHDYTVSHPAFVTAYGTDNKAHVIWQLGTTVDQYANDLALLVEEGAGKEGEGS